MSKWQQVKLGDIGKIITGKTPPTANSGNYGGNIPFITPSDMYGWRDIFCTERYLTEQGVHTVKNNVIPSGAVCVSCIGSDMGKVVIARKRCVTNQQINSIIVNDNFDQHFVYYLLLTQKDVIRSLGKNGTAIPILNKSKFSEIKVSVPPIEVQRKIADVLSAYDDLIENNRKQIRLLEEAAQRLYKEWFIDLRFPGHENTPIIDGIPSGWEKTLLGNLIEIKYGKDHKNIPAGDIPVYGSGGFMRKCSQALYQGEAVLIPRKGSLNNIMYVNETFWTVDTMFYALMKQQNIGFFVYFLLKSFDMYAMNIGAAVPSMTTSILNAIDVVLPSATLLGNFHCAINVLFSKISILKKQNDKLLESRDRLLQKLL